MKRRCFWRWLLTAAVLSGLASCGTARPQENITLDLPDIALRPDGAQPEADDDAAGSEKAEGDVPGSQKTADGTPASATDAGPEGDALMHITWDYFNGGLRGWPPKLPENPANSEIAQALSAHFDVVMDSRVYKAHDLENGQLQDLESGELPDIFTASLDLTSYIAGKTEGMVYSENETLSPLREIPWEMVELYAPRYAAMINTDPVLKAELFRDPYAAYKLWSLRDHQPILNSYSIYRLDWLEDMGIQPNGPLTELDSRLYFTEQAFTMDQFTEIMQKFVNLPDAGEDTVGFTLTGTDADADWYDTRHLLGMFGLNTSIVNEGGQAALFFGTEAYRSYLTLLRSLKESGALKLSPKVDRFLPPMIGQPTVAVLEDGTMVDAWENGWWAQHINGIMGENGLSSWYLSGQIGARLLVTPPEIGPGGTQGVLNDRSGIVRNGYTYYVSSETDDQKLAKILEIFDAVSFDPEWYVLTNYGLEGQDFTWTGVPYESPITKRLSSDAPTGLFVSHVVDENAGKELYDFLPNVLFEFATGDRGKSMILLPYKSDVFTGEDSEGGLALGNQVPYEGLYKIAVEYFRSVLFEEQTVEASWESYIEDLEGAGLREWNAYYDALPVSG